MLLRGGVSCSKHARSRKKVTSRNRSQWPSGWSSSQAPATAPGSVPSAI
jgi:hypothetical protein